MVNLTVLDVLTAPDKAVVVLANDEDKRVYIDYTRNVFSWFCRIFRQLRENKHKNTMLCQDKEKLKCYVLTSLDDFKGHQLGRYLVQSFQEEYTTLGYTVYNPRPKLKYKIVIRVESITAGAGFRANVYIVGKRYRKLLVGSFKNYADAENYSKRSIIEMIRFGTKV